MAEYISIKLNKCACFIHVIEIPEFVYVSFPLLLAVGNIICNQQGRWRWQEVVDKDFVIKSKEDAVLTLNN